MRIHPDGIWFTLLLGALAGLPALSIDMGLPGLPLVQAEFAASPATAALTLSHFMLGFGAAQLIIGPLSDRVGRRSVLLAALALYTIGGFASMLAPDVGALLVGRTIQGAGAAGGTVLAFAIIRDLFDGDAVRARLSTVSLVFSLAPVIAPTLGGLVLHLGGWRTIFAFQLATGLLLLAAVLLALGETRRALPPGPRGNILSQPRTIAFGVVGALNLANVFCFVSGAPLVLLGTLGLSTTEFGLVFALITAGVIAGAGINRTVARRRWPAAWPLGAGLIGAAAAAVIGVIPGVHLGLPVLLPIFFLTTLSRGLVNPNVTHAALERIPHMAGAGSALIGSMQMLTGALAGFIVGMMFDRFGPVGVLMTMVGFGVPALAAWIHVERKYR